MLGKLKLFATLAKAKIQGVMANESGEVNIVAIVVLIGIAVLLAIVFRGQIENLLKSLFNQINESASNAISG